MTEFFGELATSTGYARSRKLKDAVRDSHPIYEAIDKAGGIKRLDGGKQIVEEAKVAQNSTVSWVGENGQVNLVNDKVLDSAVFDWKYQLGSASWTLAERYKNSGGSDTQFINLIASKYDVLEDTMMNVFHGGMNSNGTGTGGLQLMGLPGLVPTDPTTGTVGGIDRSDSTAAWFRNQKFYTTSDWSNGAVSSSNVLEFLDALMIAITKNSKVQAQIGILGSTHFRLAKKAIGALQVINDTTGTGKAGFDKIMYNGMPLYLGNGLTYSSADTMTATRTYLLNCKPGGVNLVFHDQAEFDLLDPVAAADTTAVSRLMFTMAAMTIGGLAKTCIVGYD